MILDTLQGTSLNGQLGQRFSAGLRWLAALSPEAPDGRVDIDGDDVYALIQSYETVPASEKRYEAHRVYADIQYIAQGMEIIHYAATDRLQVIQEYDPAKDYLLFADPAISTPLHLAPGDFAIFFPHDGHKPGCIQGAPCRVQKVVIKVRVSPDISHRGSRNRRNRARDS